MIFLSLSTLVLVVFQQAMLLDCAYINVSLSAANVIVGGSVEMTLIGYSPNDLWSFAYPSCRIDSSSSYFPVYISYNSSANKLKPWSVPSYFAGRVSVPSNHIIRLSPIKFSDEKSTFSCVLSYYFNSSRVEVKSKSLKIENVYSLPVITADYTQTLIQGTPKNVICSVKSRPASIIRWTADSGVVGKESQSMIMSGHYFITTAIFHINYPLYVMDGKNIKCTVVPVIGSVVDRTMSLKVLIKPVLRVSSGQTVNEGSNVIFSCNITAAKPSTTVTWMNPSNKRICHSHGVVEIISVTSKQAGKYTCYANNGAGPSTKTFNLIVRGEISTVAGALYAFITLNILLLIAVIALAFLNFKQRIIIKGLKAENEKNRSNDTTGPYMDLSMGNVNIEVPQLYEAMNNQPNPQAISNNSNQSNRESVYLESSPHYRETNGETYANVSKPYEVMSVSS